MKKTILVVFLSLMIPSMGLCFDYYGLKSGMTYEEVGTFLDTTAHSDSVMAMKNEIGNKKFKEKKFDGIIFGYFPDNYKLYKLRILIKRELLDSDIEWETIKLVLEKKYEKENVISVTGNNPKKDMFYQVTLVDENLKNKFFKRIYKKNKDLI
ncbi:MAG: hypothetical protein K8R73_14870 [Clostridiales bacterium]|nr:hypothetical protein [Clostridiales bacterium]